jgi:hypothetical protein
VCVGLNLFRRNFMKVARYEVPGKSKKGVPSRRDLSDFEAALAMDRWKDAKG